MSDHDPIPERTAASEGRAEEHRTVASGLEAPPDPGLPPGEDAEDDEWPVRGPARGIRLGVPAAGLLAILLVAGGFWGGAVVEKNHGGSATAAGGRASGLAARLRAAASGSGTTTTATGGGGAFPGFGGASGATAGTISVVQGSTLYVLTAEGALVKVTLTSATTVSRNAQSKAVDLRPGDTVVVQGTTKANGDLAASSVAATAPGVSSAGGGLGRGFGGGGGAGAATTTGG